MAYRKQKIAKLLFCVLPLLVFSALISGCGGSGGDGTPGSSLPTKTLRWDPPVSYYDGSPLNPETDLESFEIYINETGVFSDSDLPNAALSSHEPGTNAITGSFNLANLAPYITEGVVYHVSVRAVSNTGVKSAFSPSASFSS